jgi:hypothetical protein
MTTFAPTTVIQTIGQPNIPHEMECKRGSCNQHCVANVIFEGKFVPLCQAHSQCESITGKGSQCTKRAKFYCSDNKMACGIHAKKKTTVTEVKYLPKKKVKKVIPTELIINPCKCNATTSKGQQCKRNASSLTGTRVPVCGQHSNWNGGAIIDPIPRCNFAVTDIAAIKRILSFPRMTMEDKGDLITNDQEQIWGDLSNQNIYNICRYLEQSNISDQDILNLWGKKVVQDSPLSPPSSPKMNAPFVETTASGTVTSGAVSQTEKPVTSIFDVRTNLQALLDEKKLGVVLDQLPTLDQMFSSCVGFLSLNEIMDNVVKSIYPNGLNYHIAIQCWVLRRTNLIVSDDSFAKFGE